MSDLLGKTILHYRILEHVGQGGMGVVYSAEDTKLKREVAIKFLPHHIAASEDERLRFRNEAQAAARLNHPNIATIYAIEEVDNEMFIVMEYIDGQELKKTITSKQLSANEVIETAIQIASGLQAAHEKGIIHRDIKSSNIMITGKGQVKIMDFGLARVTGGVQMTKVGTTLGTVAYMSPEQARGEDIDHRTDIWSFGVVLYEMLTGQMPFRGDYEHAVIYSILHEPPEPIALERSNTQTFLERIVLKLLEKDSSKRYQDVNGVLDDFRDRPASTTAAAVPEKSIVVLPFENMSSDPENEFFSDGLTEEIINDLSRIHALRVISRTSAMMLKGSKKGIKTIGQELGVQYVLEGSVRKAGNALRINTQLIDSSTDVQLWSEKYRGTLEDIFDIQEKVSRQIVEALTIRLSDKEDQRIARRPISNAQAYEYYLRARQESWQFTKGALDRARQYLKSGMELVGENALLHAGMGYVYSQYVNVGLEQETYIDEAEAEAQKALALDPESAEAHVVLGFIYEAFRGEQGQAIYHLKQALAVNPDDPHALMWLGVCYALVGKLDEARPVVSRLIRVDPLTPMSQAGSGLVDFMEGKFDQAIGPMAYWFEREQQNPVALFFYTLFLTYSEPEKARYLVQKYAQPGMDDPMTKASLFVKLAVEGEHEKIKELVAGEFEKTMRRDAQFCDFCASLFGLAGMKGEAFDWLEHAVSRGLINYPFLMEFDSHLQVIRKEEGFKLLMKKVKLEWESFQA